MLGCTTVSLAASALQPNDNVSSLTNDAGYITSAALSGYATETYVNTGLAAKSTVTLKDWTV